MLWESDGFVLLYKRMEVQGRFRWPRNQLEVKQLTWQQFDWLMSGLEIEHQKHSNLRNDRYASQQNGELSTPCVIMQSPKSSNRTTKSILYDRKTPMPYTLGFLLFFFIAFMV